MRVLIICPHYLPGFRSGGPVRSVSCLVESLGDCFEFLVLTHCHDARQVEPYVGVPVHEWVSVGKAKVMYLRDEDFHPWKLGPFIRKAKPDAIFLNSFFHRMATLNLLLLRRWGLISNIPVALAPRGELAPGALDLKRTRKKLFLLVAKWIGLYRDIFWVASTEFEKEEIRTVMGADQPVNVFHIPPQWEELASASTSTEARAPKQQGYAEVAYIGKVTPKKNLDYALDRLKSLSGQIHLMVVGGFSDSDYESAVRTRVRSLPPNIRVDLLGQKSHDEAIEVLKRCHVHLFPTRGENFGHAIVESLAAGCPVLLSDKTPWRDLESEGVGWDIPLAHPEAFEEVLKTVVDLDDLAWTALSRKSIHFAQRICEDPDPPKRAKRFLESLMGCAETLAEGVQA